MPEKQTELSFTVDVLNERDEIDMRKLAARLDYSIKELESILGVKPGGLFRRKNAAMLQVRAQTLLRLMDLAAQTLGERRFAMFWARSVPQNGKTVRELLIAGALDDVARHVEVAAKGSERFGNRA